MSWAVAWVSVRPVTSGMALGPVLEPALMASAMPAPTRARTATMSRAIQTGRFDRRGEMSVRGPGKIGTAWVALTESIIVVALTDAAAAAAGSSATTGLPST